MRVSTACVGIASLLGRREMIREADEGAGTAAVALPTTPAASAKTLDRTLPIGESTAAAALEARADAASEAWWAAGGVGGD